MQLLCEYLHVVNSPNRTGVKLELLTQVSGFVAFNPPSCRFLEPIAGTASSYNARYNLRAIQDRVHSDGAFHERPLLESCNTEVVRDL